MATYMYVSLQDDDKVLIFGVDSGTGNLTAKGEAVSYTHLRAHET